MYREAEEAVNDLLDEVMRFDYKVKKGSNTIYRGDCLRLADPEWEEADDAHPRRLVLNARNIGHNCVAERALRLAGAEITLVKQFSDHPQSANSTCFYHIPVSNQGNVEKLRSALDFVRQARIEYFWENCEEIALSSIKTAFTTRVGHWPDEDFMFIYPLNKQAIATTVRRVNIEIRRQFALPKGEEPPIFPLRGEYDALSKAAAQKIAETFKRLADKRRKGDRPYDPTPDGAMVDRICESFEAKLSKYVHDTREKAVKCYVSRARGKGEEFVRGEEMRARGLSSAIVGRTL